MTARPAAAASEDSVPARGSAEEAGQLTAQATEPKAHDTANEVDLSAAPVTKLEAGDEGDEVVLPQDGASASHCPVCLEPMAAKVPHIYPCGHVFCRECSEKVRCIASRKMHVLRITSGCSHTLCCNPGTSVVCA